MFRSKLLATGYAAALVFAALPVSADDGAADVPATEHQEDVLRGAQQSDTPTGAVGNIDCGMPASPHQQQVLKQDHPENAEPQAGQELQPQADMPATPHQQQVLKGNETEGQANTAVPTEDGMPASPHQQQVLQGDKPMSPPEGC
jgi:hypothetical protein